MKLLDTDILTLFATGHARVIERANRETDFVATTIVGTSSTFGKSRDCDWRIGPSEARTCVSNGLENPFYDGLGPPCWASWRSTSHARARVRSSVA